MRTVGSELSTYIDYIALRFTFDRNLTYYVSHCVCKYLNKVLTITYMYHCTPINRIQFLVVTLFSSCTVQWFKVTLSDFSCQTKANHRLSRLTCLYNVY